MLEMFVVKTARGFQLFDSNDAPMINETFMSRNDAADFAVRFAQENVDRYSIYLD